MSYEAAALSQAADLIRQHGHSRQANARDERGRACAISSPSARTYSLYGAVSKALQAGDVELQSGRYRDLWAVLTQAATDRMFQLGLQAPPAQHPIFALNDVPGFNAAAAIDFLNSVRERLVAVTQTVRNGAAT